MNRVFILTVETIPHSGGHIVSAMVTDDYEEWRQSYTYYGYTRAEAEDLFLDHIATKGWSLA